MVNPGSATSPRQREDIPLLTTITTLVSRNGHERFAAEVFARTFAANREATHHLATLLIQQEGGLNFLISQFDGPEALRRWRESAMHRRMIEAFEAHSLRELCTIDQPAARIAVPSAASGPKWKSLVASWVVTFPLLLGLVRLLDLLMPHAPVTARIAVTSIVMSVAITWLIAPFMQRLTRTWRLKNQQMKIVVVDGAAVSKAAAPSPTA
jgi:antibiotic biosynthesis monooxygenase (ABM) superfamily enzyme